MTPDTSSPPTTDPTSARRLAVRETYREAHAKGYTPTLREVATSHGVSKRTVEIDLMTLETAGLVEIVRDDRGVMRGVLALDDEAATS